MSKLFGRRWLIVAYMVCGWAAGTAISWLLPPRYRSETVILVEQQKVPEHYVESNITVDLQERLQSMSEQILSRTRLLALIDKFDLYRDKAGHRDADALVERMRKDIQVEMITAAGRRDQLSAFKVSYSAAKPKLARDITNELTSLFINENLQDREQQSQETTKFLESQLDEARRSLSEQEDKLRQFRTQHSGELPEQVQSNLQILGGLQIQLRAANDTLNQAEQRNLYLRSLLNQYRAALPGAAGDPADDSSGMTSRTASQLAALKAQLAELQGRYTDRYPDILRLKQQISELEEHQPTAVSTPTTSAKITGDESAPILQLRSELSANEFQIKSEKAKIRQLEEQIEAYQLRLNATPTRQQQAAAVTRDYDQSRTYYETLLSKKLQSEMATNLEMRRQGEQFHMIDPPNLPSRPYWPNRLAFSFGGLAAGLALGLAMAVLLELLNSRVNQEVELVEFFGSGYVLALPAFTTEIEAARAYRSRIREFVAAGVLAAVIPFVTMMSYLKQ